MRTDGKLWAAIILLIVLVVALIVISIDRNNTDSKVDKALMEIQKLKDEKTKLQSVIKWRTPVLGVDYFVRDGKDAPIYPPPKDGKDSISTLLIKEVPVNGLSAYELAIKNGFQGTLNQWLDSLKVPGEKGKPGDMLLTTCVGGKLSQKLSSDFTPQPILVGGMYIKCELSND